MAEGQRVETEMVEVSLHEEGRERVPELSEEQIAAMEEDPTYIPPLDEEGYIIPGAMDEEETEEDIWWTQRKLKPWAESTRWEKCKYCFTKCYRGMDFPLSFPFSLKSQRLLCAVTLCPSFYLLF
mmetsp:Transcript_43508/g.113251  ORF Transcript_43508/g.113251 Transcript_43508/m.113251 type:complete len:125 (+) Transcript_43508:296-670(+)